MTSNTPCALWSVAPADNVTEGNTTMLSPTPLLSEALAALHAHRRRYTAEQEAARVEAATGSPGRPPAPLLVARRLMLESRLRVIYVRGGEIGQLLGLGPAVPYSGPAGLAFRAIKDERRHDGLNDNATLYRLHMPRGTPRYQRTLLKTEPCVDDADILERLAGWEPDLARFGLAVRRLPRAWLAHAPENPRSHLLLVGSRDLIR